MMARALFSEQCVEMESAGLVHEETAWCLALVQSCDQVRRRLDSTALVGAW
jgi:hypothetical protein